MNLDSQVDSLKGIGEKTKQLFANVGVETVGDLLTYYPRAYERYEEPRLIKDIREGELVSILGHLTSPIVNRYFGGRSISAASCTDGTGEVQLTWYNMPYLKSSLHTQDTLIFRGRTKKKGKRLLIEQAAVFHEEPYQMLTAALQPVYPLTKGMTVKMVQKAVRQALDGLLPSAADYLSESERSRFRLCSYTEAIARMHFPEDSQKLQEARRRLVFDEFFFFLLQLRSLKEHRLEQENTFHILQKGAAEQLIASLPYELTGAQKSVWEDLKRELSGKKVMSRLIQGDVGSGKTILAVLALVTVAENGYQGALMAPTEVLAAQHYESVRALLQNSGLPFEVLLLTGSMAAKQKRAAYAKMESGEASIIIGTHALIQEKAVYHDLALVITDEQHRFGVKQRENLSKKGSTPHTLVMSATPIPRTLAVILYGDLDISVLHEMPANRLPIKNCVVGPSWRPKAYTFLEKQVRLGHQAYVICPMVEPASGQDMVLKDTENMETMENTLRFAGAEKGAGQSVLENVMDYTDRLRGILPKDITVESLHGRMKSSEKNEIMQRFLQNEIQVLVSTTVVEVGVNVPNATVMMVENAERFGLAQLHQLRGRVGRGDAQSYCIFLNAADREHAGEESSSEGSAAERLDILNRSNDGFEIAARDMQLRGPGDLFGIRQSGLMNFQLADVYADAELLQQANEAVQEVTAEDPELNLPEHQEMKARYERLLRIFSLKNSKIIL